MAYTNSTLDNRNFKWFKEDNTRGTLRSIVVDKGHIRGLKDLSISFSYPITAIAGRNGSGKSTLLALAACAFHNQKNGYLMPGRRQTYYTISDFFIQSASDVPVEGIRIQYEILHNNWRISADNSVKEGPGWQYRVKSIGGRWNSYESRVKRNVLYFGIERVVPHAEKSVSRSYRKYFDESDDLGWEKKVKSLVGRVLDRDYDKFEYWSVRRYRLPVVTHGEIAYSGFNMGAGENTLFEMISRMLDCPKGSLVVIDEIELGLHTEAQIRLVDVLKTICEERKLQVICTTHSPVLLESLPPEGRIFLERSGASITVIPEISPAFAAGKLAGKASGELDILVEDTAAQAILEAALPSNLRQRVTVLPVGSSTAVMRHLAARFKEQRPPEICAILDGDKRTSRTTQIGHFKSAVEAWPKIEQAVQWAEKRLHFIPGDEWPEAWVFKQGNRKTYETLAAHLGLTPQQVQDSFAAALRAGKHNEFREFAGRVRLPEEVIQFEVVRSALTAVPQEQIKLCKLVEGLLA